MGLGWGGVAVSWKLWSCKDVATAGTMAPHLGGMERKYPD